MDALSHGGDRYEEARALLLLDQLPGVGLVTLRALVDAFGSAASALRSRGPDFRRFAGDEAERERGNSAWSRAVESGLEEAERLGMKVLTWLDRDYPGRLHNLHDPPPVLFLRGRAELLAGPAVAVVGSRRATSRARGVSERLGAALGHAGAVVASGLALGVDGAAHRGALSAAGATLAVLGRGADEAYPRTHRRLFEEIVSDGLVVSEFLPGTPPLPHHFPRRNRVLAALSGAVVVVEAGARSGALITVDHALDLGVDVWAVPGPIDLDACTGSNRLLADGARPLVSISSFVREVTGSEAPTAREAVPVGGSCAALLDRLGAETLHVDVLAARAALTPPATLVLLTQLEASGLVEQLPGMRFRRAA